MHTHTYSGTHHLQTLTWSWKHTFHHTHEFHGLAWHTWAHTFSPTHIHSQRHMGFGAAWLSGDFFLGNNRDPCQPETNISILRHPLGASASGDLRTLAQHRGAYQDRTHAWLSLGLGSQTYREQKSHTQDPQSPVHLPNMGHRLAHVVTGQEGRTWLRP